MKFFISISVVFYMIVMVSEDIFMKFLDELSKIRQLLEMLARGALKTELEKIATTPERRKIWALCNGTLSTEEIARKVNVSQRTVQRFVKELREADLVIVERRGYPKRRFDYIPSDWDVEME